jgi:hypothetical protein
MCFGATATCKSCSRPTVYLLPGITRCPFLLKPIHIITGPTVTVRSCWQCRPHLPGAIDEVKHITFWHQYAFTLFGLTDALEESKDSITALETEIASAEDEGVKAELRGIKEAEEVKKGEVEGATELIGRWRHDREAPILVVRPLTLEDPSPLTFREWTAKFGVEARGQEDQEPWEALEFYDCNDYELYLEANDHEYQLDEFRAKVNDLRFISRKFFDFEPVLIKDSHPSMRVEEPRALGLMSFREWRRKERVGAIARDEQRMEAKSKAERFERALDLYEEYVENRSETWALVWHHWRSEDTMNLRRRLNEKWHLALDPDAELLDLESAPTENPRTASEEPTDNEEPIVNEEAAASEEAASPLSFGDGDTNEGAEAAEEDAHKGEPHPMTFAVWCASLLAPQSPDCEKNTYRALRSDLRAYASYLGGYNQRPSSRVEPDPIRSGHFALRQRLEFSQRNTFNHTPPALLNTRNGITIHPLSLAHFLKALKKKGYKLSTSSGWLLGAYALYLSRFEEGTVGGFMLVLNWWARDDRRELCGLPRSDPLTTKLTAVLRYLVQYITSKKDKPYRVAAEQNLSSVILMLNSCMDKGLEPTAVQWSTVREAYKRAEAIEATMRARAEGVVVEDEEDDSAMEISSGEENIEP